MLFCDVVDSTRTRAEIGDGAREAWRLERAEQPRRGAQRLVGAVDEHEQWLERKRAAGAAFSLDAAMGHLTADVITRTIFSTPLAEGAARDVFEAFTVFERQVASVNVKALLFDKPWRHTPQPARVLEAAGAAVPIVLPGLPPTR